MRPLKQLTLLPRSRWSWPHGTFAIRHFLSQLEVASSLSAKPMGSMRQIDLPAALRALLTARQPLPAAVLRVAHGPARGARGS